MTHTHTQTHSRPYQSHSNPRQPRVFVLPSVSYTEQQKQQQQEQQFHRHRATADVLHYTAHWNNFCTSATQPLLRSRSRPPTSGCLLCTVRSNRKQYALNAQRRDNTHQEWDTTSLHERTENAGERQHKPERKKLPRTSVHRKPFS